MASNLVQLSLTTSHSVPVSPSLGFRVFKNGKVPILHSGAPKDTP